MIKIKGLFLATNMSQPLPNGTHLNPKFSGAYINPNFQSEKPSQIHINPNFKGKTGEKNEQSQQILVNPNFANRALPPIPGSSSPKRSANNKPHINPNFLDGKKAKAYEKAIKMVAAKILSLVTTFLLEFSPLP